MLLLYYNDLSYVFFFFVQLINLRPSSKAHAKPRATPRRDKENPTGLVTKLGGTIVKDGLTTVHETSVIGTYINGKYAQVLQSSSRILTTPAAPALEGKIRPSSTQRILKTIGPQHGKLKPQLEPTPTHQQQEESSLPLEVLFDTSSGTYLSNQVLSIISQGRKERFDLNHTASKNVGVQSRGKVLREPETFSNIIFQQYSESVIYD